MKQPRIDKSQLAIGIPQRIVSPAYRDSYRNSVCVASRNGTDLCGLPAVGAHIRAGEYAGGAQKPSDNVTLPLCSLCHNDQELFQGPQAEWFLEKVLKPQCRRRYRRWLNQQEADPETKYESELHGDFARH